MSEENIIIFSGMKILIGKTWLMHHAVLISNHKIQSIIPITQLDPSYFNSRFTQHFKFSKTDYLIPGFIDLHIHGANNHDVMDASLEALLEIDHALVKEGVTGFLATTMSAANRETEKVLTVVKEFRRQHKNSGLLGLHLEGPFISSAKKGAQSYLSELPEMTIVKHWQSLADGAIKLMTLAPELNDATHLISLLTSLNIVAAIGHTNATYAETCAGISAGCTYATHLFNAMRNMAQREPGPASAILLSDKVMAELIVDDFHLHPAMVEMAYKLKGLNHLVLVSDGMRAKCLGDGTYKLGDNIVQVSQGKATLTDGTLAGSTLSISAALKNFVTHAGCSLAEAVQLATINPAKVLQLDTLKGSIAEGKNADLVVLSKDYNVQLTMRMGEILFAGT